MLKRKQDRPKKKSWSITNFKTTKNTQI
jgi:hypothetical protein